MLAKPFCLACRTQAGGQSSESGELPDAPLLPHRADSGDFHTYGNQGAGLKRHRSRECAG